MSDLRSVAAALLRYRFYARQFPYLAYRPMPFQKAVLSRRVKVRGLIGANRTGKTNAAAVDTVQIALNVKHLLYPEGWPRMEGPKKVWAVALDANKARDTVIPKIRQMLGSHVRYRWREADQEFHLGNGSVIAIKSQESGFEKARSADIDHAWFDEQPDERYYRETMARLIDRNGTCTIALTPDEGITWFYQQVVEPWLDGTSGECVPFRGVLIAGQTMRENRYISQKAVDDFEKTIYDENERRMRMEGAWIHLKGLVFSNFDVRRHVVEPFEIPAEWRRIRAQDWGCNSPAACLWIAKDPAEGTLHVYREFRRRNYTVEMICRDVRAMSPEGETYEADLLDPACWNRTGMGAAPGVGDHITLASLYMDNGIPVMKGSRDEVVRIQTIRRLLGAAGSPPMLVIHRNCPETVKEMRNWQYADEGDGRPEDRNNHCIDTVGYGVHYFEGDAIGVESHGTAEDRRVHLAPEVDRVELEDGSWTYRNRLVLKPGTPEDDLLADI